MATLIESRSHFGAWCIVSSPLILGYDVTNDSVTKAVWPIISNREAIAVNQQWEGELTLQRHVQHCCLRTPFSCSFDV